MMTGKLKTVILAAAVCLAPTAALATGPFNTNLVTNGGAETGDLSGWTIEANGGDGWAAVTVHPLTGAYCFATSYDWDTRHQTIDLLAAGFTAAELDAAPVVDVTEWVRSRNDAGAQYFVRYELLNAAQEVIAEWHHGDQFSPITLPAGVQWFAESHSFIWYGPGLRYIRINDGGKDTPYWAGWYGAHFDDASAMLVTEQTCPADLNGDNTVDVLDLLAVLAAWGAAGGPADINGDGVVDVLDLLEVLGQWGPCATPETGACCHGPTGFCMDLTEANCIAYGGDWQGAGTDCATVNCPQPEMGACCFPMTGFCEDLTELYCNLAGGNWQGPGTNCATFNCPQPEEGACCLLPGGDCFDIIQLDCETFGGLWQGPGTTCATTTCPTGGDTIGDAIPIPYIPISFASSTSTYVDDYDEVCPHAGSTSPDMVFSYAPAANETVTISLCAGSQYDTKVYVYENAHTPGAPFACNDDACTTPGGQQWVSELVDLNLTGGNVYYIVIDGYGGESGPFTLDID